MHDTELKANKKKLDRYCKAYLQALFEQSPCGPGKAQESAELAYAILIGLRTAVFFDNRVQISDSKELFHGKIMSLAGFQEE